MTTNIALIAIIIACVLILGISLVKNKIEIMLNFVLRIVVCAIAIYFVNEFLLTRNIEVAVGLNPVTLLTAGTLGFPGVALLYGILLYKFL